MKLVATTLSLLAALVATVYAAEVIIAMEGTTATVSIDTKEQKKPSGIDDSWPHQSQVCHKRQLAYKEYMEGCYEKAGKATCDNNDAERISLNRAQPALMTNFTSAGYAKVKSPEKAFRVLKQVWETKQDYIVDEYWDEGSVYVNHWAAGSQILDIHRVLGQSGVDRITDEVQGVLEHWSGVPLVPTSLYGIRAYTDASILAPHVDRLPLVSSAIINVAQDVDEPWPLELVGHDGNAVNITMEPGDMVLYESHSVIHGRPYPLQGRQVGLRCLSPCDSPLTHFLLVLHRYFANVFVHFEPIGYTAKIEHRLHKGKSAEGLFEQAVSAQKDDTDLTNELANKQPSTVLPPYIVEGSEEAARWKQQFVFDRVETKKEEPKHTTEGVTHAHKLAAAGNLKALKNIAANDPSSLNSRDSNGWQPIHEVRYVSLV